MSPDTLCFIANYLTQSIIGFTVITHVLLYLSVGVLGLHKLPEGTTHKDFSFAFTCFQEYVNQVNAGFTM